MKVRGVNVHVVSQIEARRLTEYGTAQTLDAVRSIAACYISNIPGAQLWFEYSIDEPHPPNAIYLFKLFMNRQHVATWDCTAKHSYYGKMAYSLHVVKSDHYSSRAVIQSSLTFSTADGRHSPEVKDDCMEIYVHRVQKRRRIRQLTLDPPLRQQLQEQGHSAVRLADSGLIEPGRPARRYQYLLLDSRDEPYAAFRFYCRSEAYLERHQLLHADRSLSPTSMTTSSDHHDTTSLAWRQADQANEEHSPCIDQTGAFMPRSPTSSNIKDSIEDLPSSVPRSPQATDFPRNYTSQLVLDQTQVSPSQQSSPLLPGLDGLRIDKAENSVASRSVNQGVQSSEIASTVLSAPRSDSGSPRPRKQHQMVSDPKGVLDREWLGFDRQIARPLSRFTPAGILRNVTSDGAILRPRPGARSVEPCVASLKHSEDRAVASSSSSKAGREGIMLGANARGHHKVIEK